MHLAFFTYLISSTHIIKMSRLLQDHLDKKQDKHLCWITGTQIGTKGYYWTTKGLLIVSIKIPDIVVINTHWTILHQHPFHKTLHLKNLFLHGEHGLVVLILCLKTTDKDRGYRIDELRIWHLWSNRRRRDERPIEDDLDDEKHIDHILQPDS